jgi:hypothetical protein
MKKNFIFTTICALPILLSLTRSDEQWLIKKQKGYRVYYTSNDAQNLSEYLKLINNGMMTVESFFKSSFKSDYDIFIHPNRQSLDSTWQIDWKMPDFKSECWMVASGVAFKFDMISPKIWDKVSCEHNYSDSIKTQRLITHELVHVFHGQLNVSPDFSNTENIDWFTEGLATYVSGQCDSSRLADVIKAIIDKKVPNALDNFWTGKLKYGISGSMVMYIDHKFGRIKMKELLSFNKKSDILQSLKMTEQELLNDWLNYMTNL